jgi:hypothetical protein
MAVREETDKRSSWWPSSFGPEDQIGMLNHITDAKRAEAMRLVRRGRLYDLAHVLDENVPVFPGRHFNQTLMTTDVAPPSIFWGKDEVAIDAFHHLVYATATGVAYELISNGRR